MLSGDGAGRWHGAEPGTDHGQLSGTGDGPRGPNDGGYAVADYDTIREGLGTVDDLRELTRSLRHDGISLCIDLVLNHVAREHVWAQKARAGDPRMRDFFWVFPDRELPDAYEQTLPEVFPDFAPGNFTWDDDIDGWVWTTFNDYQWDVNWSNPDVLCAYADVILGHANNGVEVFRLDAIAFTWKRMGTNCQNQPEVHALTQDAEGYRPSGGSGNRQRRVVERRGPLEPVEPVDRPDHRPYLADHGRDRDRPVALEVLVEA